MLYSVELRSRTLLFRFCECKGMACFWNTQDFWWNICRKFLRHLFCQHFSIVVIRCYMPCAVWVRPVDLLISAKYEKMAPLRVILSKNILMIFDLGELVDKIFLILLLCLDFFLMAGKSGDVCWCWWCHLMLLILNQRFSTILFNYTPPSHHTHANALEYCMLCVSA